MTEKTLLNYGWENDEIRTSRLPVFEHAHDSMVDEVRGNNYSGESIAFALSDSDIKETIRPYIMGRIVDFESS